MKRDVRMRGGRFLVLAALLGCFGSGCPARPEARQTVELRVPASCVPVVYDEALKPARLSDEQKEEILNDVTPLCPEGQDIWFIRVHDNNREFSGNLEYDVTVYFTPDVTTPRLRKGERVAFWSWWWSEDPAAKGRLLPKLVGTYYQVSPRGEPFGQGLEVPSKTLMPYPLRTELPDEEVIEIVDFVRTSPADDKWGYAFDGSAPILGIEKRDDVIEVTSWDWVGVTVAGAGQIIRLKKTPEGLKVLDIARLVS